MSKLLSNLTLAMYKNIIPDLVSFDTELKGIKGFEMCQNFNFFKGTEQKSKFHYKIVLSDDIAAPADYDFRSEYFVKKDKSWYYDRKIFFWHPALKYDFENRIFYFNKDYYFLPLRLGGTFTVGEHISNIIELDLFLNAHVILRGIAARVNNKNIGISAPGFNGKTTLLKKLLRAGAGYIAEDYLILNLVKNNVYPTCPVSRENFWRRRKINSELRKLLVENTILENPVLLDNLYLVQNSQNPGYRTGDKKFIDFLTLNSLFFLENFFVRAYIYDQGLTSAVFDRIRELKNVNINYNFVQIKNFNFSFLQYEF